MFRSVCVLLMTGLANLAFWYGTAIAGDASVNDTTAADNQFFETRIRPLLVNRCYECHGAETQESDLRLDSRAAMLAGGASGKPVATPGDPDASLMIQAVRRSDDLAMPPDEPLEEIEIELLTRWVKSGMHWPSTARVDGPTTMVERLQTHVQTHWAYAPVAEPSIPESPEPAIDGSWPRRTLDAFVLDHLNAAGIQPSRPADRRTLIRRLSFDLTGLPPTPDEVAAFVADPRGEAYEYLVDRLLSSPHYGERWGRHWLDVARYADTRGYAFARDRRYPFAYTYRDYVVRAFNSDLPYDRFVLEQLAADQLSLDDRWPLAGLGFLTVGRKYNNMHDDIDDKIDAVTRGFLGMTVACARCHDHKYDAIPTEDYYSLYGVFASSQEPGDLPLIGDTADVAKSEEYLAELAKRQQAFDAFVEARHVEVLEHARSRVKDYLVRLASMPAGELLDDAAAASLDDDELRPRLLRAWREYLRDRARPDHPTLLPWSELVLKDLPADTFEATARQEIDRWKDLPEQRINRLLLARLDEQTPKTRTDVAGIYGDLLGETYARWKEQGGNDGAIRKLPQDYRQLALLLFDPATPTAIEKDKIRRYLSREHNNEHAALRKAIDAYQADAPANIHRAMIVRENARPYDPRVFLRGDPRRPGQSVTRHFLTVLNTGRETAQDAEFVDGSGRLELARRIADRSNPLTARVFVNRVWMHHFGRPLVATPSDFGIRCEPPRQQLLLDYLAWYLMEHDWSVKSLQREIVLSATYRQASMDRPSALATDPDNELLWRMNRRRLEFEPLRDALLFVAGKLDVGMGGKSVNTFAAPYPPRRSVYAVIDRQDLPNLLRAFDFASPDQSAERRAETTVPQQALFLLNSPFILELASAVAARVDDVGEERADATEKIRLLYQLLLQRNPIDEEMQVVQRLVTSNREENDAAAAEVHWKQLAQILMLSNEFCFVD